MKLEVELTDNEIQRIAVATAKIIVENIKNGNIQPTPPAALPALIDEKQAAALLNVHVGTIRNHARNGNLTKYKIGNSVRYEPEEVRSLAKQKKAGQ